MRAGPGNIGVDRGRADNGQTFLDKDGNREVKDGRGNSNKSVSNLFFGVFASRKSLI